MLQSKTSSILPPKPERHFYEYQHPRSTSEVLTSPFPGYNLLWTPLSWIMLLDWGTLQRSFSSSPIYNYVPLLGIDLKSCWPKIFEMRQMGCAKSMLRSSAIKLAQSGGESRSLDSWQVLVISLWPLRICILMNQFDGHFHDASAAHAVYYTITWCGLCIACRI